MGHPLKSIDTAYEAIQAERIRQTFIGIIDNYGEGDSYDFDYTKAIVHDPKNDRDLLSFSRPPVHYLHQVHGGYQVRVNSF